MSAASSWRTLRARLAVAGELSIDRSARIRRGARIEVARDSRLRIAAGCEVGAGARILVRAGSIELGPGVTLEERSVLVAHTAITIGRRVRIGERAAVMDFEPRADEVERPLRQQGLRARPIEIGAGALIGPGATVGPGVRIGAGARVGAHVVIERDLAPGESFEGAAQSRRGRPRPAAGR